MFKFDSWPPEVGKVSLSSEGRQSFTESMPEELKVIGNQLASNLYDNMDQPLKEDVMAIGFDLSDALEDFGAKEGFLHGFLSQVIDRSLIQ